MTICELRNIKHWSDVVLSSELFCHVLVWLAGSCASSSLVFIMRAYSQFALLSFFFRSFLVPMWTMRNCHDAQMISMAHNAKLFALKRWDANACLLPSYSLSISWLKPKSFCIVVRILLIILLFEAKFPQVGSKTSVSFLYCREWSLWDEEPSRLAMKIIWMVRIAKNIFKSVISQAVVIVTSNTHCYWSLDCS